MSESNNNEIQVKLDETLNFEQDFAVPSYNDWKQEAQKTLSGLSFDQCLLTLTYEGITLKPLYVRQDPQVHLSDSGEKQQQKFKRGLDRSNNKLQSWEICQEIDQFFARDFNRDIIAELSGGSTSVNMVLDQATVLGQDPKAIAYDRTRPRGLSATTLTDLTKALENVDLETVPIHIDAGYSNVAMICMMGAFLKKQNLNPFNLTGSITADPLSHLLSQGYIPLSREEVFNHMARTLKWGMGDFPAIKTIAVSGLPFYNAGSSAVQELGFVLASAVEYLDQMVKRGISIDDAARQIRITLGTGPFYFMEIAKFRAARALWAKVISSFGGSEDSQEITIHARTATYYQTRLDPYVNILRNTTAAFAAIAGGADSLHTSPFDESFRMPNDFSRRNARNIQIILKDEVKLDKVFDPGGGSYYLEQLTREVMKKAWQTFQQIEAQGGMFESVLAGYPQQQVTIIAHKRDQDFRKGKTLFVGSNIYTDASQKMADENNSIGEDSQRQRALEIENYKKKIGSAMDRSKVAALLSGFSAPGRGDFLPHGIEAFLNGITIEEFCTAIGGDNENRVKAEKLENKRLAESSEQVIEKNSDADGSTGLQSKTRGTK